MNPHAFARGRGPAKIGLGACLITAAAGLAVSAPARGVVDASVKMASASQPAKVRYGKAIRVSGAVSPATSGRSVALQHAVGGQSYRTVASASTGSGGSYSFAVRPRQSGQYRALSGGKVSEARKVTVVPRLRARVTRNVRRGGRVRVAGRLKPGIARRIVRLQRRTKRGWRTVDRTRTRRGGSFRARWRPRRPGSYRLRVRFGGDARNAGASKRLRRVYVYRPGGASWYGGSLIGNGTACGKRLTASVMGVAHKTLPCGTKVRFRYRGRTAVARVIDRGPYVAGREWDLAPAVKRKLGFGDVGTVWSSR